LIPCLPSSRPRVQTLAPPNKASCKFSSWPVSTEFFFLSRGEATSFFPPSACALDLTYPVRHLLGSCCVHHSS
jgi:hypothetical protein